MKLNHTFLLLTLIVGFGVKASEIDDKETAPTPNEVTVTNHSGGPVLFAVRCFHHPEEPLEEFVIAPNESKDFPITCPEEK